MMGFNNYNHRPEPSQLGEKFRPDSKVSFVLNGHQFTGKIEKQLSNSAVVKIDENETNKEFVFHNNGVIIVNYRKLKKY